MNKYQEHLQWLMKVYLQDSITVEVYHKSVDLILEMNYQNPDYPIPSACTGPDKQMFYSWDKDEHHLEINFNNRDTDDYVYYNRITNNYWYDEGYTPLKFWELLKLFSGENI